jgi:hypothetical protein
MKVKIAIAEPPEVTEPLLSELAKFIVKSKRALVITGAGISCSSGIPVSFMHSVVHHGLMTRVWGLTTLYYIGFSFYKRPV